MKRIIKLIGLTLIFGITIHAEDWSMFRGNAKRTGFYNGIVGFPKEQPYWRKSFSKPIISSPSVVDQILYVGVQDSCLYALRVHDGSQLWKLKTNGWIISSPLIYHQSVIVGCSDNFIYIVDKNSGLLESRLGAGTQLSSPAIINDNLIVSGIGSPFKLFSAYGMPNPRWSSTSAKWSVNFLQLSNSSPSINGSIVVIGAGDGKLYGINCSSQSISWSWQTQGGINLSTPAIVDTVVYFAPGNYDKNVYALGLHSGSLIWQSRGRPSVKRKENSIHPMQFVQLLHLSPQHRTIILNRLRIKGIQVPEVLEKTERQLSKAGSQDFFSYGGMKTSSVAVDKNKVYVIQKELGYPRPRFTLAAIDKKNGNEVWNFQELRKCIKMDFCSSPVVTKHHVFCGWGEGKVYAFNRENGNKVWEDSLSGDIISSPAIANARLYIATMAGDLYAYGLNETPPGENFKQSTYCYPNPARNGVVHIQVYVTEKANMEIVVFNINDKPVFNIKKTLTAKEKYVYSWKVRDAANGIYFARIRVKYSNGKEEKIILKIAVLN